MIEPIKRSLAGGIVVAGLVIALVLVSHAPAWAAEVDTVPNAQPGSVVRVTGTADSVGIERVRLCWDEPGCSNLGSVRLPLLRTSYSTEVTIPATALAGMHAIYACTSLSCASAAIEIVVQVAPSTTTTATTAPTTAPTPTTTTLPTPTTTTLPPPTTTSTTRSDSAPGPETTTTVGGGETTSGGGETTSSIAANVAAGDPTPVQGAIQVSAPAPESPEDDIQGAANPPSTPSTVYVPPTTTSRQPVAETSEPEANRDDAVVVINAAAADPGGLGWSFDSPVVFWAAWVLVMVIVSGVVSGVWWLAGRRRRAE